MASKRRSPGERAQGLPPNKASEPSNPYPDEKPRNSGLDKIGSNMYGQGHSPGRSGTFPHVHVHAIDEPDDEDEQRSKIRSSMIKSRSSGSY